MGILAIRVFVVADEGCTASKSVYERDNPNALASDDFRIFSFVIFSI